MIRILNIAIVLFLIWFLNSSFQQEQLNSISAKEIVGTENTPDYYSEKLEIRQFNKEGNLESFITTDRLSHFIDVQRAAKQLPEEKRHEEQIVANKSIEKQRAENEGIINQYALLETPYILLYSADGGTKEISSKKGEMTDNNHDLKLSNDVVLVVSDKNDKQTLKIVTAELSYNDIEQSIWTDKKVTGTSEQGTFNSDKLKMDVKSEQLTLKDQVKIHYDKHGLDINADVLSSNPQTELSRLNGNILLSHIKMVITGDSAEVQSAKDNQQQQFIISGNPVNFKQSLEESTMFAKANQLVYIPSSELMEFEGNVVVTQQSKDIEFEVIAEQLQLTFNDQTPSQFSAVGKPVKFKHQIADRTVYIDAKEMQWQSTTNIAILSQATVQDGETTFSADEIKYNMLTGETSATGNGISRPSYQYIPEKDIPEKDNPEKDSSENDKDNN